MKLAAFCVTLLISSIFGAAVPKLEERVEPSEVENARDKLIFLAEKMLVLRTECQSFRDVHWNIEINNHFADTLESLEAVEANPTLVSDLRVRAAAEKQQIMDKLVALDTSFQNLRTQTNKIAEKLRHALYGEISEHFVQFKTISTEIASKYTDFQNTLSFVINDLELAVLLAINGIDHPELSAVYSHLQQSKDAANNANRKVSDAEQLYSNARTEAEVAVDVIVSQTRREKFFETRPEHLQKRDVISKKGQAQPEDVDALQFDVQTWTQHLISLNAKFSRLNNAMRLQVADSFVEIFKSMRELQVDEGTVSNIETDTSIDGQLLELTIGTLWTTMQEAFAPLDSINYELNSIDKNTRDNLKYLQKSLKDTNVGAINSDYNTVFSTIDLNLPLTLTNIRNAVAGLSGDPVIRIYLALQVIENAFDAHRQDVSSEKPIYDDNVSHTLATLQKIIDDLCSGLFC